MSKHCNSDEGRTVRCCLLILNSLIQSLRFKILNQNHQKLAGGPGGNEIIPPTFLSRLYASIHSLDDVYYVFFKRIS